LAHDFLRLHHILERKIGIQGCKQQQRDSQYRLHNFLHHLRAPSNGVQDTFSRDSANFANLRGNYSGSVVAMAWRFRGHHRTGSQNEKESIFLVLEIENDPIRHWHVSKWLCSLDIRPTSGNRDVISFGALA
jgi:hypothetical protein